MYSSSLAHTKWKCQYHIVFIPKYRRRVLYGRLKSDIREIIKKLCEYKKVEIIEGAVCSDHVHICVAIPPKLSVSDFVGYLKAYCKSGEGWKLWNAISSGKTLCRYQTSFDVSR